MTWTDSIVTTTITTATDPCGTYIHTLTDVTNGALDAAVFPTSDLVSATKSLDVLTTSFGKTGVYTLELEVAYSNALTTKVTKQF